jgi:23S rRNA (guanosine2251-2'-O)-methyltransferase
MLNKQIMQKSQIKNTQMLWGTHAVMEAWKNPHRVIHSLLVTEKMAKILDDIETPNDVKRPKADIIDRSVISKRLPTDAVHQGIAIQCEPLEEVFLSDIIIKSKKQDKMTLVMLDQVTDPHNIGAIMRSACAFGASALIVQSRHTPEVTGTMAKAACGAAEHMPIIREVNLSRAIEQLQDHFFHVIGLDEQGDYIQNIDLSPHTCLVMGAEGPGLRQKVKETCTSLLRLPTDGPVPTLNVSNAAAVALYSIQKP